MPLRVVGRSMTWGEACRLTQELAGDPSSHVAASVGGLRYPMTRTDATVRSLFDLTHQIAWVQGGKKGQRPAIFDRPWPKDGTKRLGTARMTPEQVRAVIARHRTEASDG